jgi:hypothetical protein
MFSRSSSPAEDVRVLAAFNRYASAPNSTNSALQPSISKFNVLNALRELLGWAPTTVQIAGLLQVLGGGADGLNDFEVSRASFLGAVKTFDLDQVHNHTVCFYAMRYLIFDPHCVCTASVADSAGRRHA